MIQTTKASPARSVLAWALTIAAMSTAFGYAGQDPEPHCSQKLLHARLAQKVEGASELSARTLYQQVVLSLRRRRIEVDRLKPEVSTGATFLRRFVTPEDTRGTLLEGTWVQALVFDSTKMTYQVQVAPELRGANIQKFLLANELESHPQVKEIAINLHGTNELAFLANLVERLYGRALLQRTRRMDPYSEVAETLRKSLVPILQRAKSPKQVQALREQLVRAVLRATPAGRTHTALGFGQLRHLVIGLSHEARPEVTDIYAIFTKAQVTPNPAPPRVFIAIHSNEDSVQSSSVAYTQLLADGSLSTGRACLDR